jgi:hypothetical protein
MDEQVKRYRELKIKNRDSIIYGHCRNCISDKPEDVSASEWSSLEAFIELKTGMLVVGCARCNMPVVSGLVTQDFLESLAELGGCEICGRHEIGGRA